MKLFKQLFWSIGIFALFFSCKKEKSLEGGTASGLTAQWEFKDSALVFNGSMDTAFIQRTGSLSLITLEGTSTDGSSDFLLEIFGINISTGVYKNPNVRLIYVKNGTVLYESVPINTDKFSVTISSIDSISITGTFSGEVEDVFGATKKITNGKFSGKFNSSTPQPPSGGTGQLTLWSKKGCSPTGSLSVKVQNQTGVITTFYPTEPACGAAGTATFDLPPGTYTWKALCGTTDSVTGTVSITASQCVKKEVAFSAAGSPPAQFSLAATAGNCSNAVINGIYSVGAPLAATNTVEIDVNVTVVGSYAITTTLKNGISFDASGTFTRTGIQKIILAGAGTPTTIGANSISISAGASNCAFNINVVSGSGVVPPAGLNSWSFTEGSVSYSGAFLVKGSFAVNPLGAGKILFLPGGVDTSMTITVHFPGNVTKPVPGTYKTEPSLVNITNLTNFSVTINPFTSPTEIYKTKSPTPNSNVIISVVIVSYNDSTKVVQGTFSGKALNRTGSVVDITNGKFICEVDL